MQPPGPWLHENVLVLEPGDEERFKGKAKVLKDASGVRDAITKLNQGAIRITDYHCVVYSQSAKSHYLLFRPPLTKEEALEHLKTSGYVASHGSRAPALQQPAYVERCTEDVIEIKVHGVELVRIFQTWHSKQDLYVSLLWIRGQDLYEVGRTHVQKNCEKTASWDETFRLSSCEGYLKIVVYKENTLFADVVCGEATLSLDIAKPSISEGKSLVEVLELDKKGEKTGELNITLCPGSRRETKRPSTEQSAGRRHQTHYVDKQSISKLLNRPRDLDTLVRRIFSMFAGGETNGLPLGRITHVMEALAIEIGEPLERFTDIQSAEDWFWKYNDSETKALNETQAVLMMKGMLMRIRDKICPENKPKVGVDFKDVDDSYELGKELGRGAQAIVHIATQKITNQQVVLKQYPKGGDNPQSSEEITNEFNLLCQLKHPKIARYYEVFQDATIFYIASEPYFGGDLTKLPHKAKQVGVKVTEAWLAKIVEQIAEGLGFLHSQNIIHCDLKEPNVMVAGKEDLNEPHVILIDFGLANSLSATSQTCGTPGYMPPEVWDKSLWTPRGDVFSLGCMVYTLFTGQNPFTANVRTQYGFDIMIQDIQNLTKNVDPPSIGSPSVAKLVNCMLEKDLKDRPPIKTVLESRWLTSVSASRDENIDLSALEKLAHNTRQTELRKALLMEVASRENLSHLKELNDLFVAMDKSNTGSVSVDDMQSVLKQKGWKSEDIQKLVDCLVGSDKQVSYEEFMGNLMGSMVNEENALLDRIFREADSDSKGVLERNDIEQLLKRPAILKVLGKRDAGKLFKAMDTDGDGSVSLEEFKAVMCGLQPEAAEIGEHSSQAMGKSGPPLCSLLMTRRTFAYQGYTRGQEVEYYSTSYKQWMPSRITAVDPQKGVTVDVKPGFWIEGKHLAERLRSKPR